MERFLLRLFAVQNRAAHESLRFKQFEALAHTLDGRQSALGGDNLAAAQRAPHAATSAEPEACAPRNIAGRKREFFTKHVADFGAEYGLARAHDLGVAGVVAEALKNGPRPLAVAKYQTLRRNGINGKFLGKLPWIGHRNSAGQRQYMGLAGPAYAEGVGHKVGGLFGKQPVACKLSADE